MNFIDFLRCVPTDSTLKQFMIGHGLTVSGDCILSADMVVAEIERVSCIQKRSRIIAELTLAARLASVTQVEALRRAAGHDAQVASGLAACTNNEHRSLWLLVHHRDLFDAACSNAGVVSFFEQAQPMDMQVWMPLQSGDGVFLKLQTVKVLTLTESPGIGLAASNEAVASGPLPIRAADAVAFHTHLRNKPIANGRWAGREGDVLSEATVKRVLIMLRHIFNTAISDPLLTIKENPTHAVRLTTVRKVTGRFLTREQLQRLLRAAETSSNPFLADIIRLMGSTGLRRSNVLNMRWSWFDAARGTLTVPETADKAKKGFVIHLAEDVRDMMEQLQESASGPWVFPNPATGKPFHSCRSTWVTTCKKAGLEGLRMHDLRHTFATMMLESGADIVDVQQALAHTQLKTTAVYLHLTEARKRTHANAAVNATGLFM